MQSYRFRHMHGQSMPYATLLATDDADFFDTVLPAWEKKTGFKHVPYTVTCTVFQHRKVPEPLVGTVLAPPTREDGEFYSRLFTGHQPRTT